MSLLNPVTRVQGVSLETVLEMLTWPDFLIPKLIPDKIKTRWDIFLGQPSKIWPGQIFPLQTHFWQNQAALNVLHHILLLPKIIKITAMALLFKLFGNG